MLIGVPSNEITLVVKAIGLPLGLTASTSTVIGVTTALPISGTRRVFRTGTW